MKRLLFVALLLFIGIAFGIGDRFAYSGSACTMTLGVDTTTAGDSTYIVDTVGITASLHEYAQAAISGFFAIQASDEDTLGFGLSDSCIIMLRTERDNGIRKLDSVNCAALPCTLQFAQQDATDTLFWPKLGFLITIFDTAVDTGSTIELSFPYNYEIIVKGQK